MQAPATACCSTCRTARSGSLAYYAILRADAVVVPVNPMNRSEELRHYVADSGARVAFAAQDLARADAAAARAGGDAGGLRASDRRDLQRPLPAQRRACRCPISSPRRGAASTRPAASPGPTCWPPGAQPGPLTAGPDDLCVMPYTSGTTGQPKGCMHTHRSVMSTLVGGVQWFGRTQDAVLPVGAAVFPRHRHDRRHERPALRRRDAS